MVGEGVPNRIQHPCDDVREGATSITIGLILTEPDVRAIGAGRNEIRPGSVTRNRVVSGFKFALFTGLPGAELLPPCFRYHNTRRWACQSGTRTPPRD